MLLLNTSLRIGLGCLLCTTYLGKILNNIMSVLLMNLSLNLQLTPQLLCKENFSQADKTKIIDMTWVKINLALRKSLLLRPVRRHSKCCLILVIRFYKMCILITGRWDNPSHLRVLKKGNEFPLHPTDYCHLLQPQVPPKSCFCAAAPELREI